MKEKFRDKTRDELAWMLKHIGVKAELVDRGGVQEKAENSWYQRSLGIIEILEGPIKWINILKRDRSKDSAPKWWIVMGIPDAKPLPTNQELKIKTVRKKTFPLFGKVVDVTWRGNDQGTGLVGVLSADEAVKSLSKTIGNLEIKSQSNSFQGWTLTVDKKFNPMPPEWETIQKIANYILSSPRNV